MSKAKFRLEKSPRYNLYIEFIMDSNSPKNYSSSRK